MNQQLHACLATRVREVRDDLYGPHGAQFLADAVGLPLRTWANYESGVTIPAAVLLRFIAATGADPLWLLTGEGGRYMQGRCLRSDDPQGVPVGQADHDRRDGVDEEPGAA
jgi:hypothetical protein